MYQCWSRVKKEPLKTKIRSNPADVQVVAQPKKGDSIQKQNEFSVKHESVKNLTIAIEWAQPMTTINNFKYFSTQSK